MRSTIRTLSLLSVAVAGLLLAPSAQAKLRVVATIPDFADLAKAIGGDEVEIHALVKGTQDPHFVEAKPSMMVTLNRADLLLHAGMQLEVGWLPPLVAGARNPKIQSGSPGYLDCSTYIEAKEVPAGTPDRAQGDIHPGGNPHYWTDPRNMLRIARGITERMSAMAPEHAAAFEQGRAALKADLQAHIARWTAQLAPYRGTHVVVFHRSWSYFMDFAGLQVVGELEPKPGIEPSPSHVAQLIRQVRGQGVKMVLQESFYPKNLSRLFAQKAGAKLLIAPTMVGADGTKSYVEMMDRLVGLIVGAAKG